MIESLLGSKSKEQILIFLAARKEGYAREIAKYYNTSLSPIQIQLEKLEFGGILYSKFIGKTKVYFINPRYPFFKELNDLLVKVISFMYEEEKANLILIRKRPRVTGKPL